MAMSDLWRLDEKTAEGLIGWGKALGGACAILLGLFMLLDGLDAMSSSSPAFVARQWARHLAGRQEEGESEAQALLEFAAKASELEKLARVRVWASDQLSGIGANGMFNPVVYKITLGENFAKYSSYEQRWLVFHEAGHAAAMLTGRFAPEALPGWGLSDRAKASMESSIVYKQAFGESFADVFAAAMSLRIDPNDPKARDELRRAQGGRVESVSLTHDTQSALGLAARHIEELASWRGAKLLALIDAIASEGSARSVGQWGAEREALCLQGWRGWLRWSRDGAHQVASNPWTMASPDAPLASDPAAPELLELMALTENRGSKRSKLELSWESYSARAKELGTAPRGTAPSWAKLSGRSVAEGSGSQASMERAWGRALAEYEPVSKNAARALLAGPFELAALLSKDIRPSGCSPE